MSIIFILTIGHTGENRQRRKNPRVAHATRGFSEVRKSLKLLRLHEVVKTSLCEAEPHVLVGAEFDVVLVYFFPAGVLFGQLGIKGRGFLEGGIHDVLREAMPLGAGSHQLLQGALSKCRCQESIAITRPTMVPIRARRAWR